MTDIRKTVSINQAGMLAHVSRRTIYNWIADGKVEYVRTAGGSIRIFADTLFRSDETPVRGRSHVAASADWASHGRTGRF